MKKYFLTFCALIATALTFTSCLDSSHTEETYTARLGSGECFNLVKDLESGETTITHGASYTINYNLTQGLIDVEISGLQLSPSFGGLSFKLPSLMMKFDTNTAFYTCNGDNITPVNAQGGYVFDKFQFSSLPNRTYNNVQYPVYNISFTINNRYQITVFQKENVYFGNTNGTSADGTIESNYDVSYSVSLDPNTKKATLRVYNGKFAPSMGPETFGVKELPVEFNNNGYVVRTELGKDYPIFDTSNRDIEGWSISDILINNNLNSKTYVSFKCVLGEKGSYSVNSTLDYLIYYDQNGKPKNM